MWGCSVMVLKCIFFAFGNCYLNFIFSACRMNSLGFYDTFKAKLSLLLSLLFILSMRRHVFLEPYVCIQAQ